MRGMSNPPAGWYPDGTNGQRYWDGGSWTDQRAPGKPKLSTNTYSVVGFILCCIAFVFGLLPVVGFVLAVTGIVVASVGLGSMRSKPEKGAGFVVAAWFIGGVPLLFQIAWLVSLVAGR